MYSLCIVSYYGYYLCCAVVFCYMFTCVSCFGLAVSTCQVIGRKDSSDDAFMWWGDYFHKAQVEERVVCIFCFCLVCLCCYVFPGPIQYILSMPMAWYSLPVLKVQLYMNIPNQTFSSRCSLLHTFTYSVCCFFCWGIYLILEPFSAFWSRLVPWHYWLDGRKGVLPVQNCVGMMVAIRLELCTS